MQKKNEGYNMLNTYCSKEEEYEFRKEQISNRTLILTNEQVIEIYNLKGEKTIYELAELYNVDPTTIAYIHKKKRHYEITKDLPDRESYQQQSRLDKDEVIEIYKLKGVISTYEIAKMYNRTATLIQGIHNKKLYVEYTANLEDKERFVDKKRLSEETVKEIYEWKGKRTIVQISKMFNIPRSTIQGILAKERYSEYTKDL